MIFFLNTTTTRPKLFRKKIYSYKNLLKTLLCSTLFFTPQYALCLDLEYKGQKKIGHNSIYFPFLGQSLAQIGRIFELGPVEIGNANSHIEDPWFLYPWQKITVPGKIRIPDEIHENERFMLVILDEMRLFARFNDVFITYPVGIGKDSTPTPLGNYKITRKSIDPIWHPPESIRKEQEKIGIILDNEIPPGPNNPLGTRAIFFNKPTYLIHGTNNPGGVGRRSSAGCIRMNNEHIESLFEYVVSGDPFIIKETRDLS